MVEAEGFIHVALILRRCGGVLSFAKQQFLYFFPEPQWQGSFLPGFLFIS